MGMMAPRRSGRALGLKGQNTVRAEQEAMRVAHEVGWRLNQIGFAAGRMRNDADQCWFERATVWPGSSGLLKFECCSDLEEPVRLSKAAFASFKMRSVRFSQTPRSKKGMAVAATSNLARRGILDSGSQRKSCADRKNVSMPQQMREMNSV